MDLNSFLICLSCFDAFHLLFVILLVSNLGFPKSTVSSKGLSFIATELQMMSLDSLDLVDTMDNIYLVSGVDPLA